jgi:hypothetical protein
MSKEVVCTRWHLEEYATIFLLVLALLAFTFGCATPPIRLGQGDCVVLAEKDQVIVAGSGCQVQRLFR